MSTRHEGGDIEGGENEGERVEMYTIIEDEKDEQLRRCMDRTYPRYSPPQSTNASPLPAGVHSRRPTIPASPQR